MPSRPSVIVAIVAAVVIAGPAAVGEESAELVAGGHVHGHTEGWFFPGTTVCDGGGCTSVPLVVEAGTDVRFRSVDEERHQVVSERRRRNGRRLFASAPIGQGQSTTLVTSHLKPGEYAFRCFFHRDMLGRLQIVR